MKPPSVTPIASAPLGRAALLACAALTVISGTTLAPALPSIRQVFASAPGVEWLVRLVVTLPALTIALAAPWIGRLADGGGRRRVLVSCLVLYAVSGASGLLVRDLSGILVGRALLGASAAGVMTSSTAIAAAELDPLGRSRFLARQAGLMSLGGVLGVAVGGLLAAEHWRAPFAVYLVALPIAALVARHPESPGVIGRLDPPPGFDAPESRSSRRRRLLVYALASCAMAFVFMVPLQVPFLLAAKGPRIAGAAVAMCSLCSAASSLRAGRVVPGTSSLAITIARSFAIMGVGYLLIGAGGMPAYAGLVIAGAGAGRIMPELSGSLVAATSARSRSAAIGALTSSVYAGQFLSPALSVLLGARGSLAASFLLSGATLLVLAVVLRVIERGTPERIRSIVYESTKLAESSRPSAVDESTIDRSLESQRKVP